MRTYTTEIIINNKKYNGPKIQANSFEEAEDINFQEYKRTYTVVGELLLEIDIV